MQYETVTPSPEKLSKLLGLAAELKLALLEQAKAQEELSKTNDTVVALSKSKIPELMREMGMNEFPLPHGEKLVLDDKISAKIPEGNLEAAHAWLEEHGEGGMIKRVVTVAFNRDQETAAKELVGELRSKFAGTNVDAWVEPQTLKAFAKKKVLAGAEFPQELFGVYRFDEASIKEPKQRKSVFGE